MAGHCCREGVTRWPTCGTCATTPSWSLCLCMKPLKVPCADPQRFRVDHCPTLVYVSQERRCTVISKACTLKNRTWQCLFVFQVLCSSLACADLTESTCLAPLDRSCAMLQQGIPDCLAVLVLCPPGLSSSYHAAGKPSNWCWTKTSLSQAPKHAIA